MKIIIRNGLVYTHSPQENGSDRVEILSLMDWMEKFNLEIKGGQFLQKVKQWLQHQK